MASKNLSFQLAVRKLVAFSASTLWPKSLTLECNHRLIEFLQLTTKTFFNNFLPIYYVANSSYCIFKCWLKSLDVSEILKLFCIVERSLKKLKAIDVSWSVHCSSTLKMLYCKNLLIPSRWKTWRNEKSWKIKTVFSSCWWYIKFFLYSTSYATRAYVRIQWFHFIKKIWILFASVWSL